MKQETSKKSRKWLWLVSGAVVLLAIGGFQFGQTDWSVFVLIFLAGAIYTIGSIPYYRALEIEESTNLGIFIQLAPVMYLILGWVFLGESISLMQLFSILVILLAPLLIVLTTRRRSRKVKLRAILYAFVYVLFMFSIFSQTFLVMFFTSSTAALHCSSVSAVTAMTRSLEVTSSGSWYSSIFRIA